MMRFKDLTKILIIAVLGVLIPRVMLFYLVCGILDFRRNNRFELANWQRYFLGNGLLTWILSPFNLLMDFICYKNKHIYQLTDLPQECQTEINFIVGIAKQSPQLITELNQQMENKSRGMIFFKWYGKNRNTNLVIPEFKKEFSYVRTIGVSVFNKNKSTSVHYGPLRVTLRVLYNLVPEHDGNIYIKVGDKTHYWHDNPLFIFDDTLVHQSVNGSDNLRYCMFIDIIRPSKYPLLINTILKMVRVITISYNSIFYKNWDIIN